MDMSFLTSGAYQWHLSLIAFVAVTMIPLVAKYVIALVPTFKRTQELNKEVAATQVTKGYYNPIQNRSKFWGLATTASIFIFILPFCMTTEPQPWWNILLDMAIILMVYDFFYYLVHRFIFHDGGFGPGPLIWVHSVHHQQKNPCRMDSNYLHPIETSMGLGLYGFCIGALGVFMGDFHLITIVITWIAFSEINLHNHDLMEEESDHFPFKYLKYMSFMHHVHHSSFQSGNYATISLLYDWMFGTYDTGKGWKNKELDQGKTT